jgi:multiple sugar transport system permease protein
MDVTEESDRASKRVARSRLVRRARRVSWDVLTYSLLAAFCLFFLAPVLWIILSSFKRPVDVNAVPPVWLFTPVLDHYVSAFWRKPVWHRLANSLVASSGSVLISAVVGTAAAYGISRMRKRARNAMSFLFLSYRMAPLAVLVIPIYAVFTSAGLYDTHLALILAYTNISLPIMVWMMVSYFEDLPVELEEAAVIDGCSALQCFLRVALPLAVPGLIATGIFCMVLAWSDFLLAVVLTGPHTKTIALEVLGGGGGGRRAAISVVAMVPIFVFMLFVQKRLVRGLTMGAVKG